ncbi:retrovirus-related pol polyprotein from transposon TNT 1-94 [Tanacetum coccineum]|uniref:Retrovirus-related pol polyprotein from transposon TNT 1-94 n=1 Tax=Tanacetum coccineum TaxID=301880 RepID=A0ABQ5HJ32_9ASTR
MDSMILIGQKDTLAKYMILSSADNRPPMLDKDLYDSWKIRMELYMQNREHERMILESVEHGPLIWPIIEENGVTRIKKYAELFATEKIQADCDMKATNIILQGLPSDIYSLERECKLYDAFDKFTHIKGESLHHYYLRFTQLINNINIYKMKMEQFQVNTKFLDSLPPEWSKFVTDVKLVKDLHTTNFDQLHAYIEQLELYANEVRLMLHHDAYPQPQSIPQIKYTVSIVNQQTHLAEFPHIDFGLAVLVFKQGDDPIDAISKMMSFLSTVVTSPFPSTNNQLRNSSNPRQQAIIHARRVIVQPIQGRQTSFAAGMSGTRANISGTRGNNSSQQRVVKCCNCQREGHMARQCPKQKRKRDATWFTNKVLLVEAQGNDKVLNEEELEFLADLGIADGPVTQTIITHNAAYQIDDLDAYDFDCDDFFTAKAVLMANLSSYGLDVLSEVPHFENTNTDMLNQNSQYLFETQNAAVQDTNSSAQQDTMILSVFEQLSNQVTNCNKVNRDNLIANETLSAELERYKERKAQQIRPMLYDGNVIAKETNVISIADSKETLMLKEESRSKMLLKQKLSDEQALHPNNDQSASSPVKIEALRELPKIKPDALIEAEWGFEHTKAVFQKEIIPFLKTLKTIFNVFDKDLLNEVTEVQTVFNQMEAVVQQYHVDKQCFEIQKKQFLIENDRLLVQIISQDIVNIVVNSSVNLNNSVNVNSSVDMNDYVKYVQICNKCLELEAELIKQHNMVEKDEYNRLLKSFSKLEQHCISLELAMQLNKEIFQKNNTSVNKTEPSFDQLFELNNLKAELQAKDTTIENIKNDLRKFKGNDIVDNAARASNATTIAPRMYKLDPVTLAPKDKNNRETHIYYLKHTMEKLLFLGR